ncbi:MULTISPECIES: TfoX/Sxy family DNA transformation protein [Enterobacter]|uniref:TfoX/Sxy family DNA transformation protein n=1 Tax=Enterobacter TaxID=547 RepID=UPI00018269EA|nr:MULTISPECIES: TfoX/Sxy family DNA transformation protein [Enterobacter]EFC58083.1 TfoX C-terminal domain protein [Enterobacter cancerogenus ATCC 35316]EKS7429056.1 TfoX/Sxy family DNA transformation protein [Enterobacter cancerogenus]MDI3428597.1 TfoX/Sxy family DNA transformation protein [Enterobacter sp. V87_3]CAD5354334.1 Protein Sxy [Enterobacter cancerogenus]HBI6868421.1 TfoX/Sxy family DNA transformation protein [Enterobacter cancerogenus]
MKKISYERIYKSQEYLSPLGEIHHRALFGGYTLAVDDAVFAMVSDGELYLRACEESATYCVKHPSSFLTLVKRGRPVLLNYYRVDEGLWQDRQKLLQLSSYALDAARKERSLRYQRNRLKDLPNLTFQIEVLLYEAGITNEETLRELGAKTSWLKIRSKNRALSIKVLFALEGAIEGMHEAALPANIRRELTEWFNTLPEVQESRSAR